MNAYLDTDKGIWRSRLASYSTLLVHWGWFIVLSIILITFCTVRLPDSPSVESYQATLQVEIPASNGVSANVTFFSQLFTSPSTLSLTLPKLNKLQQFRDYQLSDLQALVTAAPVVGANIVSLSATGNTTQDATIVVNDVYQTLQQEIQMDRSTIAGKLEQLLQSELKQCENDIANSSAQLQNLQTTNQQSSSQYHQLNVLYHAQMQRSNAINAQLTTLSQPGSGTNGILSLTKSTLAITTIPASAPTMPVRLALSPLIGLIMGVGGAMLVSRFSSTLSLRGKKREKVPLHIICAIPVLSQARGNHLQMLEKSSSYGLLLLRRLRHYAVENERPLQVITITSPKGREGKSTIATSLAIAAAQSGLRTLLVDIHPRQPVLHTWFHSPNTVGTLNSIRSFAAGIAGPSPIINTSVPKLNLIPIGNTDQKKAADTLDDALRTDGLLPFTQLLRNQADLIIFDGPPLLGDASAVHPLMLADAVLLVVDAKRSQSSKVLETEAILTKMGVFFSLVLNRAKSEAAE